jgi:P4 family phage/plasmid primase-like protien
MSDDTRPWKKPEPHPEKPPKKGGSSPANAIAQRIMQGYGDAPGRELFTDKANVLWEYTGTHWIEVPEPEIRRWAWDAGGGFSGSRSDSRNEVASALKAVTYDRHHQWGRVAEWEVPCLSGVIDVRSGAIRKHDPNDRLDRVIPWKYDPKSARDVWHGALSAWWGEGSEMAASLQDFFGYMMLNHCRYKRACIVYGPSNTGKSRVVQAGINLVGVDATCQLSLDDMEDPRRRGVIVGKALNHMTELTADALIRQGGFNAIVSGEPLLIDDKYKPPFMYAATAKHLIAGEELPRVTERGEGAFTRLLIVPMTKVFEGDDQDTSFDAKLLAQMPGVFAWAVEGARRLVASGGGWVDARESILALSDYRKQQNPVVAFLEECCQQDISVATPLTHLLRQFNVWHRGSKRLDVRVFAGLLRRHLGRDCIRKVKRRREFGGTPLRCLMSWKFTGLPRRLELQVAPADAVSRSDEIESTGEEVMLGEENPQ